MINHESEALIAKKGSLPKIAESAKSNSKDWSPLISERRQLFKQSRDFQLGVASLNSIKYFQQ